MKTRIYLGEDVVVATKQINRYKIEFSANPSNSTRIAFDIKKNGVIVENVDKTFNGTTSNLSLTITGLTPTITAENLLGNLEIYNTNSITTYQLATEVNSYGNLDIYIDVVGDIADVFTFTSLSNTTGGKVTLINVGQISTYNETEIGYSLLDLYEDENIEVTSKLSDIEKLSNVFLDFSNSFSLPATSNNNDLFQHYYDVDIDNTFNANIRIDGYIEIDSFPFRFGKIQLEGIKLKNQKPDSYKITFYGGVIQLSDLFGDDTINKLDYDSNNNKVRNVLSQYDFDYTEENILQSLNQSFKDGDIMTPLISYTNREWNIGPGDSTDISTILGSIKDNELKQAIRVIRLIEAIESKYDISFSRNFFGSAMFNNLFMWLNGKNAYNFTMQFDTDLTPFGGGPISGQQGYLPSIDLDTDIISIQMFDVSLRPDDFSIALFWPFSSTQNNLRAIYDTSFNVNLTLEDQRPGREGNIIFSGIRSFENTGLHGIQIQLNSTALGMDFVTPLQFKVKFSFNVPVVWNSFTVRTTFGYLPPFDGFLYQYQSVNSADYSVSTETIIPNMKVIDFLHGTMKMFKLIIRPLSGNQFYVDSLNGFYSNGNVLDVTPYVDQEDINIERPLIYKDIKFKFEKTNNVLGKKFRSIFDPVNDEIGYGDLIAKYDLIDSKDSLEVKLPFENMLFERISISNDGSIQSQTGLQTNVVIGQSISPNTDYTQFSPNNSKPILFFNNGVQTLDNQVVFKFLNELPVSLTSSFVIGNTNDLLLNQVTDTINWGAEVDPWHNQVVANSLYLNYWSDWVNTIYDLKQRKFTYEGYLPPRFIEELSLNDRLIIGNNRYKINDYKINLLDGKTQLTLFNDIFDWNAYSFPSSIVYNERSFSPNGWYMTDTIDNGDSAYIYGSFTGYNSTAYGRIVKLLPNGDVDTSFNTGTGFNSNFFGFQSIVKQTDGKILATGDFTSFNGTARNRIARLNTDGSLDTSLVVGTGFNNITSGVEVDSQGRIVVCGSYGSYSGVSANRIIRLLSGGTVDTSFVYGTAFNNITNSVVINSDDSMYVGGYFSTYSGITSNRIIKLTSGGTVDTSFNVGTGLNSNTNQPVGLISDGDGGVYVFGYFTTYSGITANRLTKLLPTGQIDPNFNIGSGFNGPIITAYKVLNDKLLIFGTFTQFNGLTVSNGLIVLNADGGIYRTFTGSYVNVYTIGNRFYGNLTNGATVLLDDESLPTISPTTIIANAGVKYYGINILKNFNWSVTKIDLGYGTDWIDITTPSGTRATEVVIRIEEKTTQSAPQLYQPRYMILRFNFSGVLRDVTIVQNGLLQ
jgi:hypothetical protein